MIVVEVGMDKTPEHLSSSAAEIFELSGRFVGKGCCKEFSAGPLRLWTSMKLQSP